MIQGVQAMQGMKGFTADKGVVNSSVSDSSSIALQGAGSQTAPKDATEASTAPALGDVLQKMQARYGARPDKPKEIKKTLGKDDFMRIMLQQMKNQDPTKPFDADRMGTEMAQFASVEQLQNLNQAVTKMAVSNQPLERMAMTNLIGKTITVDRERFPHSEGVSDSLSFTLARDASQVQVSIVDAQGEKIFEKDLGSSAKGENTFTWDGIKSNTLPSKSGNYLFKVEATDTDGRPITIIRSNEVSVVGVSFEGNDPILLVGDPAKPEKVSMRSVSKIVDPGHTVIPGAKPLTEAIGGAARTSTTQAQPAMQPQAQGNLSFFGFEKGKGSVPLDSAQLSPEIKAAMKKAENDNEKGFPSGLSEGGDNE